METQIGNIQWPETIYWQDPYTGELIKMYRAGIGAYPYECIAQDKHPDSVIYREKQDGTGGWIASHKLKEIRLDEDLGMIYESQ